jgi:hypothetical protein
MARFVWPTPSNDYFAREFGEDERQTLSYRIDRLRFIWEEFDMLLVGGITSMFALEELKRSYVYGNYMATVLLAQAYIEQSLGGAYSLAQRDSVVEKGFAKLIDTAREDNIISADLADALHALRRMRNPYTHHTIGTGARTYMGRLFENTPLAPEDLVVEDAKFAIRAVVDYLRHGSPHWNPDEVTWEGR